MNSEYTGANYNFAKAEADKIDAQIIETLKSGHSFRVEAGAGSGKTYSLNRIIEWVQANKWSDYSRMIKIKGKKPISPPPCCVLCNAINNAFILCLLN